MLNRALVLCLVFALPAVASAEDPLAAVASKADLDSLIAATKDAGLKKALTDNSSAILEALKQKVARDQVAAALDAAKGSYTKGNTTPEALQKALGGPSAHFDVLKTINLADTALTIKEKRKVDPFDAAFYEAVGKLQGLEELTIINTTAQNEWLAPLANLTSLKALRIINQAKLDDAGLALLAPLKQLESFGYIGTRMTGAPIKNFKGWTNLKSSSYRGSKMSDEGLIAIVEAFPNLQSLVLAHGDYNNAALANVAKLTKLTGLELGSHKATPEGLKPLTGLKLEYLQLGEGFEGSPAIAIVKEMPSIKKLVLTNCAKMTDEDLRVVSGMKQVENLELTNLELPQERLALLKDLSHLKILRLAKGGKVPYTDELKAAIKATLPGVMLKFE